MSRQALFDLRGGLIGGFTEAIGIPRRMRIPKETNSEFKVFRLKFEVTRAWGAKPHNGTQYF
jgi:hypothetical protein